jgi:hypothetical protein
MIQTAVRDMSQGSIDPNLENKLEREAQQRDKEIADAEAKRNKDFVQVYPKGWAKMRTILSKTGSTAPLMLYTFLAEHIDADGGVLVADQETICASLDISRTTLWRACKFLEDHDALIRLRVGGSVYAYALDPSEVWRSWDSTKENAVFRTRTMVRKSAQDEQVQRRLMTMIREQRGEPELPLGKEGK